MTNTLPPEYVAYKSRDPFPDIAPALLNSADIEDYANTVGLVRPFDRKQLKSATYAIPFDGEVHVWNKDTKKREVTSILKQDDYFELLPNSIAYVSLSTLFYLPDYIALRFNLHITHVHRGLLLGTGPLVDPGFCGQLLIPLHNLTSNPYVFTHGTGLIWVEFTKLSANSRWTSPSHSALPRTGRYVEFKEDRNFKSPVEYLQKAYLLGPIISSIPAAMREAKESADAANQSAEASKKFAQEALNEAKAIRDKVFNWGLFSAAAFAIGVGSLMVAVNATVQDSVNYVRDTTSKVADRLEKAEGEIKAAKEAIATAAKKDSKKSGK